jgi:formyltetrahydrofolate deformylase
MSSTLTEITVVGTDDTGLIARVTSLLFERDVNIEDVDQAVREDLFRMTLRVDTSGMDCSEAALEAALSDLCGDLGLDVTVRFPSDREPRSIAVLVTKESHCLEAMLETFGPGGTDESDATVEVVIGNHSDLAPLAADYDVPFHDIGDEKGSPDEADLLDLLEEYEIDLIALGRYIRILGPEVVFRYESRIINVHPSLLPAFPGAAAYMQAIEKGVRIAGVTAHYVTPDLDQGPIITQRAFNVPPDVTEDALEATGQPLEADALVEAVRLHLAGRLTVGHGRTHVQAGEHDRTLGLPEAIDRLNPAEPVDARITGETGSEDGPDIENTTPSQN